MKANRKVLISTAVAGLMSMAAVYADSHAEKPAAKEAAATGKCHGADIPSCKGTSDCAGNGNASCKGANSCKGQGWKKMTEADCTAKKGTWSPK